MIFKLPSHSNFCDRNTFAIDWLWKERHSYRVGSSKKNLTNDFGSCLVDQPHHSFERLFRTTFHSQLVLEIAVYGI